MVPAGGRWSTSSNLRSLGNSAAQPNRFRHHSEPMRAFRSPEEAEEADGLDLRAALTEHQSPGDLIEILAIARFATGDEPFCSGLFVQQLPADADLSAFGGAVARQEVWDGRTTQLVVGDGWTMRLIRHRSGECY